MDDSSSPSTVHSPLQGRAQPSQQQASPSAGRFSQERRSGPELAARRSKMVGVAPTTGLELQTRPLERRRSPPPSASNEHPRSQYHFSSVFCGLLPLEVHCHCRQPFRHGRGSSSVLVILMVLQSSCSRHALVATLAVLLGFFSRQTHSPSRPSRPLLRRLEIGSHNAN